MQYQDRKMEEYFQSLPMDVQSYINQFGTGICSLGELMLIGEHFRNSSVPEIDMNKKQDF